MTLLSNLPPAIIFIVGAVLLLLLPRRARPVGFLVVPAVAFFHLLSLQEGFGPTLPFLDYELAPLRVDRLSLAFAYVFVIIAFLGGFYSFHVKDAGQQVSALLYAGSALGVVFAGDLFTLFVFWEIMVVGSVWLIWARRTPEANATGMRYTLVHLFGGSALLAGILWRLAERGSLEFTLLEGDIPGYLILFGFALNAAIPPLHAWLADAYPQGTVTGSVFLSAFTTKTAVYTLARGFAGMDLLIWAGVIMALYGVVFAVLENDIRRLLAYHIISQVGYMVTAVGIGTDVAINGATAHAFTHILYKALLFMGAGVVLYTTGKSKLTELGGLARLMPVTLALYMVGAFSISGFPLFSGFVSKSIIKHAAELDGLLTVAVLLNLASVGTFLHTGLKLPYFTWLGPDRGLKPGPTPWGMYAAMGLTALLNIAIGVYPALLYDLMPYPVDYEPYTAAHVNEVMQIMVFTGLGFWLLLSKLGGEAKITLDTDWFYRRPARLAHTVFVVWVNDLFSAAERVALQAVRPVVQVSSNPIGALVRLVKGSGAKEPPIFNPDRYRISTGTMMLVALIWFLVLLALSVFAW